MNGLVGHLLPQERVHHLVLLDPGLPLEGRRDDGGAVVRLLTDDLDAGLGNPQLYLSLNLLEVQFNSPLE